jgi:hypothetical protein
MPIIQAENLARIYRVFQKKSGRVTLASRSTVVKSPSGLTF